MNKRKNGDKGLEWVSRCPKCGAMSLKQWRDLDRDERIAAERIAGASVAEIKEHRYCTRCWYVETEHRERLA